MSDTAATGPAASTPAADGHEDASVSQSDLSRSDLLEVLAAAVLAVPGVVRLEPTLRTDGPSVLLRRSPTDGLHLLIGTGTSTGTSTGIGAGTAEVDVNIATTAATQARAVAHRVRTTIGQVLTAHGHTCAAITISVLRIDPH